MQAPRDHGFLPKLQIGEGVLSGRLHELYGERLLKAGWTTPHSAEDASHAALADHGS